MFTGGHVGSFINVLKLTVEDAKNPEVVTRYCTSDMSMITDRSAQRVIDSESLYYWAFQILHSDTMSCSTNDMLLNCML